MPTLKNRVHVTMPEVTNKTLQLLARRDKISVATKTLNLIETALELEEDAYFTKVAETRLGKPGKLVSHAEAWL